MYSSILTAPSNLAFRQGHAFLSFQSSIGQSAYIVNPYDIGRIEPSLLALLLLLLPLLLALQKFVVYIKT